MSKPIDHSLSPETNCVSTDNTEQPELSGAGQSPQERLENDLNRLLLTYGINPEIQEPSQPRLEEALTTCLLYGDNSFERSVSYPRPHLRGPELNSLLLQLKKTQENMTLENLGKLETKAFQWMQTNPQEYELRGDCLPNILRDVDARKKDALLGQAGIASTNAVLINLVRQIYGEQLHDYFSDMVPGLQSHDSVQPDTIEKLCKCLQTPYVKNFKFAETLVANDPSSSVNETALRWITAEVAKLPHKLLQLLYELGVKIIGTEHTVVPYVSSKTRHSLNLANNCTGIYLPTSQEVIIALHQDNGKWNLPHDNEHGGCNLVLYYLGVAVDIRVGNALLWHPVSDEPAFQQAFLSDWHQPEDDIDSRRYAFAEGFAAAFNELRKEGSPLDSQRWPAISRYMKEQLPTRLHHPSDAG